MTQRIFDDAALEMLSKNQDAVYDYSRNLIEKLGTDGFILQSGCDIPTNAKLENVKAIVAAATG